MMDRDRVLRELEAIETLGQAIRWSGGRAEFRDVIVQDEYTHDVILRVAADLFAVFDTT
jgi:hypothetical protein